MRRGSVNSEMRLLFDCCVTMLLTVCNIDCLPRSVQILSDSVVTERSERERGARAWGLGVDKARHTPQTNTLWLEIIAFRFVLQCLELFCFMAVPRYLCSMRWLVDGDDANVNNVFYLLVNNVLVRLSWPSLIPPVLARVLGHDTIWCDMFLMII